MENSNFKQGYSLKKGQLKRWIYKHSYTQYFIAKKLDMTLSEMKDKLNKREPFNEKQITKLVYLMGAEEAFEVIYFSTLEEKKRVAAETFLVR